MKKPAFTPLQAEANAWLIRRDRGLSSDEEVAFASWQAADPGHTHALAEAAAVWTTFEPATREASSEIQRHIGLLQKRDRGRRRAAGATVAIAACLALILFGRPSPGPARPDDPVTARVEMPSRETLPDNSIVELRPGAIISVAFEAHLRRVVLNQSEAHFTVAKDASRPFVVVAGGVEIRAIGTAFSVKHGESDVEIIVTDGKVRVTAPGMNPSESGPGSTGYASEVTAGSHIVVSAATPAPAVAALSGPALKERLSWRLPRIELSNTSVAEAIKLFSQQTPVSLHADADVASLRLTGVFRSDNVEGFVRSLEGNFGVRVERRDGEIRLRMK